MKLVAAIRGRLARLLVRLARKLDSAQPSAPVAAMPERMALLRQRYAGAPQHWLEAVARRIVVGEAQEPLPPPPAPPPLDTFDRAPSRAHAAAHFEKPSPTHAERPQLRFAAPTRSTGAALHFDLRRNGRKAPQPLHLAEDRRRRRPGITFRLAGSLARASDPPVAPVRRTLRSEPDFAPAPAGRERRQDEPSPAPSPAGRTPHEAIECPPLPQPRIDPPATRFPDAQPCERPQPRFPDAPARTPMPAFEQAPPAAGYAEPSFRGSFPEWPDLPALADEDGLDEARRDEAALIREQMVGRWSA